MPTKLFLLNHQDIFHVSSVIIICVLILRKNALNVLWMLWFEEDQIYFSVEEGHWPHIYTIIQRVNGSNLYKHNLYWNKIIFCSNPRLFLK